MALLIPSPTTCEFPIEVEQVIGHAARWMRIGTDADVAWLRDLVLSDAWTA